MTGGACRLKIAFDRGTLIFGEPGDPSNEQTLAGLPGVLWDPRVLRHRALAYRYHQILGAIREAGHAVDDSVLLAQGCPSSLEPSSLRPYQAAAVASHQANQCRGIIVMPTGTGKTHVAIAAMERTRSCLCLVPTRVLLHQWRQRLLDAGARRVGIIGDGLSDIQPTTVTTFESAYRHMARLGNHFEMVVVDEAHHFGNGTRDEALEMCAAPRRLGLTATPPDSDALGQLEQLLGPVVFRQSLEELRGEFLAEFELLVLRLPLTPKEQQRYDIDYGQFRRAFREFTSVFPRADFKQFATAARASSGGRQAMAAYYRSRELLALTEAKRKVVGELLHRHSDSRTMVFTDANASTYQIATEHLISPITCDIQAKERQTVLSAFREGSIRAIVSARVLNEGIDIPDADVAIIVGGSHGEREHVQRVGRLLRPRPGKRAIVYELISNVAAEMRRGQVRRRTLLGYMNGSRDT